MSQQSMVMGMMIAMVNSAPIEFIVNQLEEGLQKYKETALCSNSDNEKKEALDKCLGMAGYMLLIKISMNDDPMKMMKDISELDKVRDLLNHNLG